MRAGYRLDPPTRLRILAAALPGSTTVIREIKAPFRSVWAVVEDLERFTARYEQAITAARFDEGIPHSRLRVTYATGQQDEYVVRLSRGWCLMQSPLLVVAFAARASKRGTTIGHLEHWRQAGRPRFAATKLEHELLEIERLALMQSP